MKVVLTLCIIIALCGTIFAANNHSFGYVEPTVIRECKPIWKGLESLSQTERQNAILKIELPKEKSIDMIEHSSLVENKWNSGNYAGAIELFRNFADLQDVSCGIQWKEPIKTESKWGEDVQIGSREDIYVVNLDVENANGNLFAAFLYPEDTQYKWSVYISEDTGKTWLETYIWWASFYINDISAVVAGNYFFVGYTHNGIDSLTSARVRRFDTDSGYVDGDYGWIEVFDHGITIEDIALTSNADYYNDRVYYTAIQSDNSLCFYWNYPLNANWLDSNPLVNDALRGLDICTNKPYSVDEDIFSYVSYINTDDSVVVLGINYIGIWQNYGAIDYSGCLWAGSSISAYYDTVITMFPHYGASNPWVKYRISYDAGAFWYWWFVGDTTHAGDMCDVTSRNGDGMGAVHWLWDGEHQYGMYSWRDYPLDPWSAPVEFSDYEPRYSVKPVIERVSSGIYGIVYADFPYQNAYFDRSDWITGICENFDTDITLLSNNYPEPFNEYTTIKYQLPVQTTLSLDIYDVTGRLVKNLFNGENGPGNYTVTWDGKDKYGCTATNGIYFYRLSTGDFAQSRRMTLLR